MLMSIENNDDVCEACGVFVELGSVIHEDDNVLSLPIAAPDQAQARALADQYISQARTKYPDCEVTEETEGLEAGVVLQVNIRFSCTAERLIFEMALR
jgi:uncharacterized protein YfcZ (UPF0381/DUF406 family)